MEIIVGKNAGFCYGVKTAVEKANIDLQNESKPLYFLGEIVHNQQVVEELKSKGAVFIDHIEEAKGPTVVRAHGVPKEVYADAKQRGIVLKDYTCPNVLKIHKIAEEYAQKGYYILLFGSKKHPEIMGTMSYCGDKYYVIEDEVELYNAIDILNHWQVKNVLVISQTTFNVEAFENFKEILQDELNCDIHLVIENTICYATHIRQQETEELAQKVDCMVIIGGRNSSNTKKLYEIAEDYGKSAICVETKEDIQNVDFSLMKTIGVMAGASTPQSSIEEVVEFLRKG